MIKKYFILAVLITCHQVDAVESPADPEAASLAAIAALIVDAVDTNPGILSAQASVDAAAAREQAGHQPIYNPELEIEAEDAVDRSASLGISQSFDWRNKRAARGEIASFEHAAAVAELHRLRQQVAMEILNAVSLYDVANRQYKLSGEREKLMRQFAALATQRKELGDLTQTEYDLAHLALAEAQIQQLDIALRLTGSQQALAAVLGTKPPVLPAVPELPPNAEPPAPDIEQIVHELPAMRAQLARIAAAKGMLKLRTLETKPDPTLGVRVGQEESEMLAGVSVSIPLYIRNNYKAEVAAAGADVIRFELEAQDLYRRIQAQLETSIAQYKLAHDAWTIWEDNGRHHLGNQFEVLERLWRAGELSTTDYLVQVTQTLNAQMAAEELRARIWQEWFGWLTASGQVGDWLGLDWNR